MFLNSVSTKILDSMFVIPNCIKWTWMDEFSNGIEKNITTQNYGFWIYTKNGLPGCWIWFGTTKLGGGIAKFGGGCAKSMFCLYFIKHKLKYNFQL